MLISLSHPLPQVAFSSMAITVTVVVGSGWCSATCSSDCFYLLIFLFKQQVAFRGGFREGFVVPEDCWVYVS